MRARRPRPEGEVDPVRRASTFINLSRDNTTEVVKYGSLLFVLAGFISGGCSRATSSSAAQSKTKSAQALVDSITGNARASRNNARTLRAESDRLLAAKNYNGAMDKRLEILSIRSKHTTTLSVLSAYATQSLAVRELGSIASHLDALSCRKYAGQLETRESQKPTFAVILQGQEADELKQLAQITRTPQEWQTTIAGLGFTAKERASLQNMPATQVQTHIKNAYAALKAWAQQPYSSVSPVVSGDPYTTKFAVSPVINLVRFFSTKSKAERLLTIAALQQRADRLERRKRAWILPIDPFGDGPLKEKGEVIYSVGPDTKDDGGKAVPRPINPQINDKGDIQAPIF